MISAVYQSPLIQVFIASAICWAIVLTMLFAGNKKMIVLAVIPAFVSTWISRSYGWQAVQVSAGLVGALIVGWFALFVWNYLLYPLIKIVVKICLWVIYAIFWILTYPIRIIGRLLQFSISPFKRRPQQAAYQTPQFIHERSLNAGPRRVFHGTSHESAIDIFKRNRLLIGRTKKFWTTTKFSIAQNYAPYGKGKIVEFSVSPWAGLNNEGGSIFTGHIPHAKKGRYYRIAGFKAVRILDYSGKIIKSKYIIF
jgi:hypothetical protein